MLGSGCGSDGRASASVTGDQQFKSSRRQILFTINCIEKAKIKTNEAGKGPCQN